MHRTHREQGGVHVEGVVVRDGQTKFAHNCVLRLVHKYALVELGSFADTSETVQCPTIVERVSWVERFHPFRVGVPIRGFGKVVLLAVCLSSAQGDPAIVQFPHCLLVVATRIGPSHSFVRSIALHQLVLRAADQQPEQGYGHDRGEVFRGAHQK